MNLEKYINRIEALEPMAAGFMYRVKTWNKLSLPHQLLIKDFEGKQITRSDVIKEYELYFRYGKSVLKPFLLTMIWGFSDTGYGTHRTNNYLATADNVEKIKQSLDAVKKEDIKTAFKTLKSIKGLGVSYLTKVLYFASKAAGLKNYSLIYDIRVASSLVQLNSPKQIFEIVSVNPSSKYNNYSKYNRLMHELAIKYKVEADAIELFLFKKDFK